MPGIPSNQPRHLHTERPASPRADKTRGCRALASLRGQIASPQGSTGRHVEGVSGGSWLSGLISAPLRQPSKSDPTCSSWVLASSAYPVFMNPREERREGIATVRYGVLPDHNPTSGFIRVRQSSLGNRHQIAASIRRRRNCNARLFLTFSHPGFVLARGVHEGAPRCCLDPLRPAGGLRSAGSA